MKEPFKPTIPEALPENISAPLLQALDKSCDTLILTDADTHVLYANEAMLSQCGCTLEELCGIKLSSLWIQPHERSQKIFSELQTDRAWRGMIQHRSFSGDHWWESSSLCPLTDPSGTITHLLKTGQVSEKMNHTAVDATYNSILNLMSDGYLETDLKGNITYLNKQAAEIYQRTPEELIGMNYKEYMTPVEADKIKEWFFQVFQTGKPIGIKDYNIIGKNGKTVSCETQTSLLIDSNGEPIGFCGIIRNVTEKKETERLLKESEESYRRVMELAPDAITITRVSDGKYFEVNETFCRQTGWAREEVLGSKVEDLKLYADPKDREELVKGLRTSGFVSQMRIDFIHRDGSLLHDVVSARIISFKGEECVLFVATLINDFVETQQALIESEKRYRLILDTAPDAIILTRMKDGKYIEANDTFYERTGFTPEETIGKTVADLRIYQNMADRERFLSLLMEKGQVESIEIPTRYKDGTISHQLWAARLVDWMGEKCVLVIAKPIDDLKHAQQLLEKNEENYRTMIESAPYSVDIMAVPELTYIEVNDTFCHNIGYTREEILGKTASDLNIFRDPGQIEFLAGELREKGKVEGVELALQKRDGTHFETLCHILPIIYQGQRCFLGANIDITPLKKAQSELKESEARFRTIFETAADAILVTDLGTGRFLDINQRACQQLGYTEEELNELSLYNIISSISDDNSPAIAFNSPLSDQIFFESAFIRKDGSKIPVEVSSGLVSLYGKPAQLSIVRDVTERKEAEAELEKYRKHLEEMVEERTCALADAQKELLKKERLSVLGQLTATVSHELRNPLGVIRSSNFYLKQKITDRHPKIEKHIARIDEQVSLCDIIVADLLEYTRGSQAAIAIQPMLPWIYAVLDELRETQDFHINASIPDNIPNLPHDPRKMRRVLINLLENAIQAVLAKKEAAQKNNISFEPEVLFRLYQKDENIEFQIIDNGIGMDADTAKKAFEPLFTTRARGTGIGLAIVRKILSEHTGEVHLASEPDNGTTVTVTLPIKPDYNITSDIRQMDGKG